MFIQIEGIDGAGKTTQCELLKHWFELRGQEAVLVKELGSTALGRQVHRILTGNEPPDAKTEMFLFLACKAEAFSQIIVPSLAKGKIVITDRGSGSFIAYNSIRAGVDPAQLTSLLQAATLGIEPDLTCLLDMPVRVAMKRSRKKSVTSKFDFDRPYLLKQKRKMNELARLHKNWVSIDATKSADEVHLAIIGAINRLRDG